MAQASPREVFELLASGKADAGVVPIESLVTIGHSMGGLAISEAAKRRWPARKTRL